MAFSAASRMAARESTADSPLLSSSRAESACSRIIRMLRCRLVFQPDSTIRPSPEQGPARGFKDDKGENMSDIETSSEPKFAALVGIDWGDKKHAWALQVEGSSQIERGEMLHTPEAIQEWVAELRRRFPTGCLAVALEQSRGPLVFAL